MIVYFLLLATAGIAIFKLGDSLTRAEYNKKNFFAIKTIETLSAPDIWDKVHSLGASYYKQTAVGFFLLALFSFFLARGVLAIFIFIGIIGLIVFLLWRVNQLEKYAAELYREKQNKLLTKQDDDEP